MKIDASIGEVVDKLTILDIKLEKMTDQQKLKNIRKEHELLEKELSKIKITSDSAEFKNLREVNERLWEIEDKIRIKEAKKEFDEGFVKLARSVYFENDKRAKIKKEINLKYGSELVEEKEYVRYK
jgi:protein subunit release factor A